MPLWQGREVDKAIKRMDSFFGDLGESLGEQAVCVLPLLPCVCPHDFLLSVHEQSSMRPPQMRLPHCWAPSLCTEN